MSTPKKLDPLGTAWADATISSTKAIIETRQCSDNDQRILQDWIRALQAAKTGVSVDITDLMPRVDAALAKLEEKR